MADYWGMKTAADWAPLYATAMQARAMLGYGMPGQAASQQSGKTSGDFAGVPSWGQLYKSATNRLAGWGNQAQSDLKQNYLNAMGMAEQRLAQTGLSGTTIAPSMRMGYMKQYSEAVNRLNDQIQNTKLQYQTQIGAQANVAKQRSYEFSQNLGAEYARIGASAAGMG